MGRRQPDHYSRRAQAEGFRARSVYKLEEIDAKVRLLRPGLRVLDLGCAPGSWARYAGQKVGPRGRVVGIDLKAVPPLGLANVVLLQGDAFGADPRTLGDGLPFDVVLSDMAPATTGNRLTDHVRSVALCERALTVALAGLRPGGAFVCKVFEGEDTKALFESVRLAFDKVQRVKPKSTRDESVEFFIVAQGARAAALTGALVGPGSSPEGAADGREADADAPDAQ